jgi:transcriptional regulator with XRE-family HTH domain
MEIEQRLLYNYYITFSNNKQGVVVMKINIGENLKRLRLKKDLTQEQFAEVFGVSPQAVSRWENNTAYPDITMLPGIAVFYNTTIDELIGMDEIRKNENIAKIHVEVNKLVAKNQLDEATTLLRDGLKLYPNNSGLISVLAQVLTQKCNMNNDTSLINEAIYLCERALKSDDISMKAKSTVIVNLIFLRLKLDDVDKAKILIKSLPHIWESREILIPESYNGDEYAEEFKKTIIKVLVFFCDKIKNHPTRKYIEVPSYFQLGVDFEPKESVDEMLDRIRDFINE